MLILQVSYLTAMDIYLWICFLYIFLTILEFCILNHIMVRERLKKYGYHDFMSMDSFSSNKKVSFFNFIRRIKSFLVKKERVLVSAESVCTISNLRKRSHTEGDYYRLRQNFTFYALKNSNCSDQLINVCFFFRKKA